MPTQTAVAGSACRHRLEGVPIEVFDSQLRQRPGRQTATLFDTNAVAAPVERSCYLIGAKGVVEQPDCINSSELDSGDFISFLW